MEKTPREPLRKRMRGQVSEFKSKFDNFVGRSQQPSTVSLVADHPDRPASASPNISQELSLHVNASSAVSLNLVPDSTPGTVGGPTSSPSTSSTAMQNTKFAGKFILGLLSSATEGVPVPGVKGIFDTISKVIGVIEASDTYNFQVVY
jgi:hypothetical protein